MAAVEVGHEQVEGPVCWCCGTAFDEEHLVRLGNHPEVGVCGGCAQWLHRRSRAAASTGRSTPGALARRGVGTARRWVMRAGVQDWPLVGPLLRRLDRHLP